MRKQRIALKTIVWLVLWSAYAAAQMAPKLEKVEPPNWWVGMADPMLMIKGENLTDAKVTISMPKPGVSITRTENGLSSKYLFVWLAVAPTATPGELRLRLTTSKGAVNFIYALGKRNPASRVASPNGGFNGFNPDDVIYLIMPDRFADGDSSNNEPPQGKGTYDRSLARAYHGGDLKGMEKKMPYLKDLGVTTIWINPIYNNDDQRKQDYHGYGAVDFYAVEEHFGTMAEYQHLVQSAHELGMKIVLDIVPNHAGPTHPWVNAPPTEHWLHGTKEKHLAAHSPFAPLTDPHSTPAQWRDVVEGWFADVLPDLNTDDAMVSQYLRQNALWWAEMGALDGFRLDTFPYVDRKFWHDFHGELHKTYPRFTSVGEVFNPDPAITSYFVGGKVTQGMDTGVDSVFDFPMYYAIRDVVLHGAPAKAIPDVLRYDWMYPHPENLVTFIGNHDTKRFMGEAGATKERLKLAFSLLATLRGIPQLYSGDEIGMPGGDDPDNRRDFPGGFPGDPRDAFTAAGRTPDEQDIFTHLQSLLRLRREHKALRSGMLFHMYEDGRGYAFVREFPGGVNGLVREKRETLLIVANTGDALRNFSIPIDDTPLTTAEFVKEVFAAKPAKLVDRKIQVEVAPMSVAIYQVECGCDVQ